MDATVSSLCPPPPLQTGAWTCTLTLEGVAEFQRATVNAVNDSRVEDIRIDASLAPTEYWVSLAPDFDTFLIPGSVSVRVEAAAAAAGASAVHLHTKDQTIWEDTVVVARDPAGAGVEENLTVAGAWEFCHAEIQAACTSRRRQADLELTSGMPNWISLYDKIWLFFSTIV